MGLIARRRTALVAVVGAVFLVAVILFAAAHGSLTVTRRPGGRNEGTARGAGDGESPQDRAVRLEIARKGFATVFASQFKVKASEVVAHGQSGSSVVVVSNANLRTALANAGGASAQGNTAGAVDPFSIFVSVASYRDSECAPTVADMYERAKRPKSLYLGIVEQHDGTDPRCTPGAITRPGHPGLASGVGDDGRCNASWCPSDNMKIKVINPRAAKGPTFGRYHGMLMYGGERYFMMIDSHNRFVSEWDDVVITMYEGLPTKKGVLSHYPEAWNNPKDNAKVTNAPLDTRPTTTYLCNAKFVDHLGFPRLDGFVVPRRKECRPQPWAAAGFLFADAKILTEVPFDPHLHYVFDGEEILYSVRMWTHGWDIFSPLRNVLYHYYYRPKAHKFWSLLPAGWDQQKAAAERRIQFLLKTYRKGTKDRMVADDTKEAAVLVEIDKYGLGTERTLEAWYDFSGVDRVGYKLTKNFCQKYS